jgi:hypothetical protein
VRALPSWKFSFGVPAFSSRFDLQHASPRAGPHGVLLRTILCVCQAC